MRLFVRRYGIVLVMAISAIGIGVYSVNTLVHIQQRRNDYDRYLYRALESCRSATPDRGYGLLARARSFASNEAEEDFIRTLMPKFRAGDCTLPGAPRAGDVEVTIP